ncbi:MAG: pyruvate kinase [Nitrospirota bacterium]|nr:pyruvate kinase [Nitrospirota bacterium]MDE3243500.1 pyruvate kinase [Nitrospirota bacterium]
MRKAKIVCTIGPASQSPAVLDRLIAAGLDAARLNFSHGSHESHARAIAAVREAAAGCGRVVAIIQDLQGPRIRIGALPAAVEAKAGAELTLTPEGTSPEPEGGALRLPVTYPDLARDVKPGARILINDGLVELTVERVVGEEVRCRVVTGGLIASHKGLNLPGTTVSAPAVTEKDREDLRFGLAQGVDYVALSFVRGPEDIAAARQVMAEQGKDVPVIAKIERAEAVEALEAILEAADGVMIARGDLGVELEPEAVPVLQKRIIQAANRRRRLVITATQMLESMTEHPRPTRAEASDVANAVFDGTDAVMLSAETAAGRYPVESVQVMDRIVRTAEENPAARRPHGEGRGGTSIPEALCEAALQAAEATGSTAIVAFSESGTSARLMSKQRPAAPIVAFTPFEPVRRRMALYWGVLPLPMQRIAEADARVHEVERRLAEQALAKPGARIVILSGTLVGQIGGTNTLKVHEVGPVADR